MASIQGIYLAFFGRPADPEGLAFWEEQTQGGADLSVMLNALAFTEEYQVRFEGMTEAEIITSVYQSLFNRAPEPEGLAFFLGALAEGSLTLASIAVGILDGAQGDDLITIQNKEAAANLFTASLDTPEKVAAYVGEDASQLGRDFISQVSSDPQSVPSPESVQNVVNELPGLTPPEGQEPEPTPPEVEEPGTGGGGGDGGSIDVSFNMVDNDGVVTFTGSTSGAITIQNFSLTDEGTATVTAFRSGIVQSLTVENFAKIQADDQWIVAGREIADKLVLDLTNGSILTINTSFPQLTNNNPELPSLNISSITVDGSNYIGDVWNSIYTSAGAESEKFKLFWNMIDQKHYEEFPSSYNSEDLFYARVFIAEKYVEYLEDNSAIVDIVQTKVSGTPRFEDRQQSLHDNILAEIRNETIRDKWYGDAGDFIDPRSPEAAAFGERPYEGGNPPKAFSPADAWDALNGVNRPDLAQKIYISQEGPGVEGFIWVPDRAELDSISISVDPEDATNSVVSFNIDSEGAQGSGTPGPAFARYQGASIRIEDEDNNYLDIAHGATISFDFYIDPEWISSEAHLSGVWIQLGVPESTTYSWAIMEYLDAGASGERFDNQHANDGLKPDEDFVGFRFWKSGEGYSKYVEFEESGWVKLSFDFGADQHVWSLNGSEIFSYTGDIVDTTEIVKTLIFNSQNFGVSQNYLYDNIEINGISINEWFYT